MGAWVKQEERRVSPCGGDIPVQNRKMCLLLSCFPVLWVPQMKPAKSRGWSGSKDVYLIFHLRSLVTCVNYTSATPLMVSLSGSTRTIFQFSLAVSVGDFLLRYPLRPCKMKCITTAGLSRLPSPSRYWTGSSLATDLTPKPSKRACCNMDLLERRGKTKLLIERLK